jgi:hypothetical protein
MKSGSARKTPDPLGRFPGFEEKCDSARDPQQTDPCARPVAHSSIEAAARYPASGWTTDHSLAGLRPRKA